MNNEIDLLDELEREERDERLAANGGGAGAALGVLLTLVIGCGLVFAAYKLGQRKTVDEPPMIAANDSPIKIAPEDTGGTVIPNTDNLANAMIDGTRPALAGDDIGTGDLALRDGVVVEANLPDRAIDQTALNAETRELRREVTQLNDLEMKHSIEGEPSLALDGVPDRSNELNMVAGAEVAPGSGPSLDELVEVTKAERAAAAVGQAIQQLPELSGPAPVELPQISGLAPVETVIASALPSADADQSRAQTQVAVRMPTPKPNLGPSSPTLAAAQPTITNVVSPPDLAPQRARPRIEPAIARVPLQPPAPQLAQPLAQPRVPQVVQPQVQPQATVQQVRIPPQPIGDAQVQLGAHASPQEVRGRWAAIKGRNPDLLSQLGLKVTPVQTADGRQLFLMRVGPLPDSNRAAQLCQALGGRGIDCFVPQRQ